MKEFPKKVFEYLNNVHGNGVVQYSWSHDFSFLAVCGENKNVYVTDRRGKKLREIPLSKNGHVKSIDWDKDNEFICIV